MAVNPDPSELDQNQIIQRSFDSDNDCLRVNIVTGTISVSNPSIGVNGAAIPTSSNQVGGKDGSGNLQPLSVDVSGNLNVNVLSSALPTGAATSAKQDTGNTSLASIDSKLTSPITVTGPLTDAQLRASAVPISAASLPLPSGAATSANQTTEITALGTINITLGSPFQAGGSIGNTSFTATQATGTNLHTVIDSGTVTANAGSGTFAISAAALPLPTGAATSALQTQPGVDIGDVTVNNAAGAAAVNIQDGGNSITVDGTFFQATQPVSIAGSVVVTGPLTDVELRASAVPVSASALPLPSGAATSANQSTEITALGTINTTLGSPFQTGGSIGNTTFTATQATGTNLHMVVDSGTITTITNSVAITAAALPLPTGAATSSLQTQPGVDIGDVTINNAAGAAAVNIQDGGNSITVDGTFFQATQPVSIAASVAVTGPLTDAELRATAVPISGTVTANAGSGTFAISAAALPLPSGAATLAGQTQPGVDIGDVTINNASGGSAVNIQDGGNSITVDGTVAISGTVAATQSGTWTVQPGNTANTTAWLVKNGGMSVGNQPARNDYSSVNVTTATYVQLVASTSAITNRLSIFDSSGQTLAFAVGAAASEVIQFYIFPGGTGDVELAIPAGSRIAIKAISATASSGEIDINFFT